MKTLAPVCIGLLLCAVVRCEDRRTDLNSLTIMTFNAEFLWDGVAPEEGNADFPWKESQTEAEEHMAKVAVVIKTSNPDIVNLVEIENLQALSRLNDLFLAGRGYKPYLVEGKDTQTGQDVALLTRIDPDSMQRDDRRGESGGVAKSISKNYIARITIGGRKIAFIGIHFLAIPPHVGRKLSREAQADAARLIAVDERAAGYLPVVWDDFNDYDDAPDSRDHINSTPITKVLRSVRGMAESTATDNLLNVASLVLKDRRYTAFYDANENGSIDAPGEFTSIDHVLISPELVSLVETVDIPHEHDPRVVSDHFPIVVRFKLAPTSTTTNSGNTIRIESLLPNPVGDDNEHEAATLINLGSTPVELAGWKLRDLAGQTWTLDALGTLAPGERKTIKRLGQAMALNNNGDTIDLVNNGGTVVHTVTYAAIETGELVTPAN